MPVYSNSNYAPYGGITTTTSTTMYTTTYTIKFSNVYPNYSNYYYSGKIMPKKKEYKQKEFDFNDEN